MIKASFVIPTLDKLSRLRLVLKSLESQVTDEVEVIVIFDGCKPETVEEFKKLKFSYEPVMIVSEKNIGRACARNKGIEAAHGKVVFFLDDDRIVAPGYIESHLKLHDEGFPVVLGQRNQLFISDSDIDALYEKSESITTFCENNSEIEHYHYGTWSKSPIRWMNFYTGNVSVNRDVLLKVNGFDESFTGWGHEDLDLGIRIYLEGAKYAYSTDGRNYHMMHESNFISKKEQSAKNMKYLMKKYRRHPFIWLVCSWVYLKMALFGVKISKTQYEKYKKVTSETK